MKNSNKHISLWTFFFLSLIFSMPQSASAQTLYVMLTGLKGEVVGVAGYDSALNTFSCKIPLKTVHLAPNDARLTPDIYDQTANLITISRPVGPASKEFLLAAKTAKVFTEMIVDQAISTRNGSKPIQRYVFKDVVVQRLEINMNVGVVPVEFITFSYSGLTATYNFYDPRTGDLRSSNTSRLITEMDARKSKSR